MTLPQLGDELFVTDGGMETWLKLAAHHPRLRERLPNLRVAGGCCGTDDRHIAAIGAALS